MSDDRDNPFGPPPPEDPFGPPPADDPFGRPAQGDPHGPPPSGQPLPPAPGPETDAWRRQPAASQDPRDAQPARAKADGAVPALVLGILGIVLCPLCAPFAWYYGRRAEGLVDASGGVLGGRGEATAGKILGMIACALMAIGLILFIVFGVLLVAGTSS